MENLNSQSHDRREFQPASWDLVMSISQTISFMPYSGRSFKDIGQAYLRGEEIEDGGRYIYVFDLKGNPVRKYVLDHAIYGINVDEDTGTILATDVNSNDPILSFKI